MFKKRLLPAAIYAAVTLGCLLLSRPTRILYYMALCIISAFEVQMVMSKAGYPSSKIFFIVYSIAQGVFCWIGAPLWWMVALHLGAAAVACCWVVLRPATGEKFAVGSLFLLTWPYGAYIVIMRAAASEVWLPVLMIGMLTTWAGDSMALIGGMLLGKHKLAPEISPNKTWEGAIVGAVSSGVAGYLLYLILRDFYPMPMVPCIVVTFLAGVVGQLGDLVASAVKRLAGVKDFGSIMPVHGGIVDKMDSMLFSIPFTYLALYVAGVI